MRLLSRKVSQPLRLLGLSLLCLAGLLCCRSYLAGQYRQEQVLHRARLNQLLRNAVMGQDLTQVRSLLAQGADPNTRLWPENIPMLVLASRIGGDPRMLRVLLAAGANPNVRDGKGRAVLWPVGLVANPSAHPDHHQNFPKRPVSRRVAVDKRKEEELLNAVWGRDQARVLALLRAGVSPNTRGSNEGTSVLNEAIEHNDLKMVRLLLNYGADPNGPGVWDYPPLTAAYSNPEILQELLKRGASVNAEDPANHTALYYAVMRNYQKSVEILIKAGGKDI